MGVWGGVWLTPPHVQNPASFTIKSGESKVERI
jgi:hypothetical protein